MQHKIACIVLLLSFIGCGEEKEYPHKFPVVLTGEIANITANGAEFSGRMENLEGFAIKGYGFVWDLTENPTLNSSILSISSNAKEGKFSQVIQSDLEDGETYFVRAFIQTDKVVVYGDSKVFSSNGSLAPSVTGISPSEGVLDTEITITGDNFSTKPGGNLVTAGGIEFPVISMSKNELRVKQPTTELAGSYSFTVEVAGQTTTSTGKYFIIGPIIESMSKTIARVGELLTLTGQHFEDVESMFIEFGDNETVVTTDLFRISDNQIGCYVPDAPGTTGKPTLHSYLLEEKVFRFEEPFTIVDSWQQRSSISPLEDYMGYAYAQLSNLVYVIGGRTLYEYNLSNGVWTKKQDFPGDYRFNGTAFTFNGNLYYGFGSGVHEPYNGINGQYYNDIWSYNPSSNTWSSLGNTPLTERLGAVALVIGNKVYIGFGGNATTSTTGFGDFWEYSVTNNSWTQINTSPLQGDFTFNPAAFSAANKGYVIGLFDPGYNTVVWEFDPSTAQWTRKSDLTDWVTGGPTATTGDHGLVVCGVNGPVRTYEYDPVRDVWFKRQQTHNLAPPFKFGSYYDGALHLAGHGVWKLSFD